MSKNNNAERNKNSRVISRYDRTGKLRTETVRRDEGDLDVSVSTDLNNNSTRLFIDENGRNHSSPRSSLELDGHQARTLYLTLQRHFDAKQRSANRWT
jgi:hypothetical protein